MEAADVSTSMAQEIGARSRDVRRLLGAVGHERWRELDALKKGEVSNMEAGEEIAIAGRAAV